MGQMKDSTFEEGRRLLENLKKYKIKFCKENGLPIPAFDKDEDYYLPEPEHPIEFIKRLLPLTEILAQLAEEAAELAHAAHKLRRALDGTNPTPMLPEVARKKVLEECADVLNCMMALSVTPTENGYIQKTQKEKQERWVQRLKEKMQ